MRRARKEACLCCRGGVVVGRLFAMQLGRRGFGAQPAGERSKLRRRRRALMQVKTPMSELFTYLLFLYICI